MNNVTRNEDSKTSQIPACLRKRYELINRLIKDIIENNAANFASIAHGEGTSHQAVRDNCSTKSQIEYMLFPDSHSSQKETTNLYSSQQSNGNEFEKIELMIQIEDFNEFGECVKSELSKLDMVTAYDIKKKIKKVIFEFNIDKSRHSISCISNTCQSFLQDPQTSQYSLYCPANYNTPDNYNGSETISPYTELSQISVKVITPNTLQSQMTPDTVMLTPSVDGIYVKKYDSKPEIPESYLLQSETIPNTEQTTSIPGIFQILNEPKLEENINSPILEHEAVQNLLQLNENLIPEPIENYTTEKLLTIEYNHEVLRKLDIKLTQNIEYTITHVNKFEKADENINSPVLEHDAVQDQLQENVNPIPEPIEIYTTEKLLTIEYNYKVLRKLDIKLSPNIEYKITHVNKLEKADKTLCIPEVKPFLENIESHVEPQAESAQSKLLITFTTETIGFDRRRKFTSIDDNMQEDLPVTFSEIDEDSHDSFELLIDKKEAKQEKPKKKSRRRRKENKKKQDENKSEEKKTE